MNKSGALQKALLLLSKKVLSFRDRKNILILNDKYIPVYNAYSGQTETMQAKWANLKKWKKKHLQRLFWEKQISANLILLLKTGRIRVVTRFSKRLTKN